MSYFTGSEVHRAIRRAAETAAAVTVGLCAYGTFTLSAYGAENAGASHFELRVDHDSFWYQRLPRWNRREPWEEQAAPPGSSARLERAIRDVIAKYGSDFPQPPPFDIVVQAPPREDLDTLIGYMANRTSYGGARRDGATVYIDVNQCVFAGPDRLNDAELRAFLGHELVHAYQYDTGRAKLGHREIFRREVAAYTWELSHLEPAVRSEYRGDIFVNLHMYREMLGN